MCPNRNLNDFELLDILAEKYVICEFIHLSLGVGVIGQETSTRVGYSDAVVRDLRTVDRLVEKIAFKQPWVDNFLRTKQFQELKINKRMVNILLMMHSLHTSSYLKSYECTSIYFVRRVPSLQFLKKV